MGKCLFPYIRESRPCLYYRMWGTQETGVQIPIGEKGVGCPSKLEFVLNWFHMCYFIVVMSSLLFYKVENCKNMEKSWNE
jgi:hypothetical protein